MSNNNNDIMAGLEGLPAEDQARMLSMIEGLQIRDHLKMYNNLVERCFTDCVDTFTRKTLQKQEETCVSRCAEKFLKHQLRVTMRFQELSNQAATED